MDALDIVLVVLLVLAAIHGGRLGASVQLLSFVGLFVGLIVGAGLVHLVAPTFSSTAVETIVAIVLLTVPASLFAASGHRIGLRVARLAQRFRIGAVDVVGGVFIAVAGTLVLCWLFASILVNTQLSTLASQIDRSRILRHVDAVLPPVPETFAAVQRYLAASGFPQVLINDFPQSAGPVHTATARQRAQAIAAAGAATVKVVAIGCGQEQEGSGFAVGRGIYVTNAHVVAGTHEVTVEAPNGQMGTARVIEYDPRFDLAVLQTRPLGTPSLQIDPAEVSANTVAVVLGYPEGGPFQAREAGVAARFVAVGRDIYDTAVVSRTVYQLQAVVRPGNSGGPLVTPGGEVIGVVFSRSASNPDIGYALASPGVLQRVQSAEAHLQPTSTEGCTG